MTREKNKNRWVMLMYQLPTKPSNLRVKAWRRIQKLGAVGIRNSAYVLPVQESHLEDFQWLKREIVDMGGEASVFIVDSVDDVENDEIEQLFRNARDIDYSAILKSCDHLSDHLDNDVKEKHLSPERVERHKAKLKKITSKFDEIRRIDFFSAPLGAEVEKRIETLRSYLSQVRGFEYKSSELPVESVLDIGAFRGRIWVTRKELHIDRIASGWLIRRFIDDKAMFEFVDEGEHIAQQENRVPFDMYAASFGHHGEYCTFETFIRKLDLGGNTALAEIAEIVHDIDLKDSKFGREEARGVDEVIIGLGEICENDDQLMEAGGKVFDALYARMRK